MFEYNNKILFYNLKKSFTLIELIIVVVTLAILAAIIIPNVADMNKEAATTHIFSNTKIFQTAVDHYALNNGGKFPTDVQPTLENPQKINVNLLYPDYIRKEIDLDKVNEQKYWIDVFGKVWGSTQDSPNQIYEGTSSLEIDNKGKIQSINLYEVRDNKLTGKVINKKVNLLKGIPLNDSIDKVQFSKANDKTSYLISSIDEYGLESAPVGPEYLGYPQFDPLISIAGEFEFIINSKDTMYWDSFRVSESKPEGTDIQYHFAILESTGNYSSWNTDFYSLPPSKGIKVKVTMISNGNKYPSLYDMRVYYHYEKEKDTIIKPTLLESLVNPDGSGRVVHQVQLPENEYIDSILVTDSYKPNSSPKVSYESSLNGSSYVPVDKITSIPAGSTVKIIREGDGFISFQEPIVKKTNKKPVVLDGDKVQSGYVNQTPDPLSQDPQVKDPEWTEISRISYMTGSGDGQKAHWISATIDDYQPTNTRILYRYAYGNGTGWSNYVNDFASLKDSRYLKVTAILQVKTTHKNEGIIPKINSIQINHSKGVSDLSTVQPTAIIKPVKIGNENSEYFDENTKVEWTYEAQDPNGRKVVEAEWGGDIRENYPVGTYTVNLRVRNEDNYWSEWTSYELEVKSNKPIAVIKPDMNYVMLEQQVNWDYSSSVDPDGDGIQKAEWSGDKQETYSNPGEYTVSLRVMDTEGNWSDTVNHTFTVSNIRGYSPNYPANANIYVDANKGSDTTGNGTLSAPFQSINKAIENVTVDQTAIRIAGGVYYEDTVHVPGTYGNREYGFVRSIPDKDYALIGDSNNIPVVYLNGIGGSNYIVQLHGSTVTKPHTYDISNINFRINDTSGAFVGLSDLSVPYLTGVNFYNVTIDNSNGKISYLWYLNGGSYNTYRGIQINVHNSTMDSKYLVYRNNNGTTVNYTNSMIRDQLYDNYSHN